MIWVGTSWKMNKTLAAAAAFIDALCAHLVPHGIQAAQAAGARNIN